MNQHPYRRWAENWRFRCCLSTAIGLGCLAIVLFGFHPVATKSKSSGGGKSVIYPKSIKQPLTASLWPGARDGTVGCNWSIPNSSATIFRSILNTGAIAGPPSALIGIDGRQSMTVFYRPTANIICRSHTFATLSHFEWTGISDRPNSLSLLGPAPSARHARLFLLSTERAIHRQNQPV